MRFFVRAMVPVVWVFVGAEISCGDVFDSLNRKDVFVYRPFDYLYEDEQKESQRIKKCVIGLNDAIAFEKNREKILERAQNGNIFAFEWLFDAHHNPFVEMNTGEHSYFKKLWPNKNIHDFFMVDLQENGVNLKAFDYYLYDIRPEKSLMVEALKTALEKGWNDVDKYMNVMWQLFNDIREDSKSSRKEWVQTFKELQCLGYMKDIVTLDDLKVFPLGEMS